MVAVDGGHSWHGSRKAEVLQPLQMLAAPVRTRLEDQDSASGNHLKVPLHIIFQDVIIYYWGFCMIAWPISSHGSDRVTSRCVCV